MLSADFSPAELARQIEKNQGESGLPPVEQWNPDFCGDIDMRITRDGQWFYQGSVIGRAALVRMFSTILKREGDAYFLVTPAEKVGIQVEDVPFIVTQQLPAEHGKLRFLTNVGDEVTLDAAHPLQVTESESGEPRPYLEVRNGLAGRLHRNLFYQLVEQAEVFDDNGVPSLGIFSDQRFWSLGALPD